MRLTATKIPNRHRLTLRIPQDPPPPLRVVPPETHQEPEREPDRQEEVQTHPEAVPPGKSPLKAPQAHPPVNYEAEAVALLDYFIEALPAAPVRLSPHVLIEDPELFIASHLDTLLRHPRNPVFQPYLDRLRHLRQICASASSHVTPMNTGNHCKHDNSGNQPLPCFF